MTASLDDLRDALQAALPKRTLEKFSDERFVGFHDGADGVQWHIASRVGDGRVTLAVNLEGLAYGRDGQRPIEKLVKRERYKARVLAAIRSAEDPAGVTVHLARDAWAGPRTRVPIEEWTIGLHAGSEISDEVWLSMMGEGVACLSPEGGRGRQMVTRAGRSVSEELEVVPHFNASRLLWDTTPPQAARRERVREVMALLQPVYDAVVDRVTAY